MNDVESRLGRLGIKTPEILLPRDLNIRQWAVIACDQFTQDRAWWERAGEIAAASPSTLKLIFPEVFLSDNNSGERVDDIHRYMRHYLDADIFEPPRRGLVYLERDTPFNRRRRGIVAAIDLELYDWSPTARPLIRASEGTVPERLPARMDVRRNAALETQHILLLIDDESDSLLDKLGQRAVNKVPLYRGELMQHSGSVSGWFLDSAEDISLLADGLEELSCRALTRYSAGLHGVPGMPEPAQQPFLFAVGDGNHSLASAKGIWEEYKAACTPGLVPDHPCRYALVEIENIYDPAITFEPIHRVVFGLGLEAMLTLLAALPGFSSRMIASRRELVCLCAEPVQGNRFGLISGSSYALIETSAGGISTAFLQPLLDDAVDGSSIDYIHGEDALFQIAGASGSPVCGVLLPPVHKGGFFQTVAHSGPLPRKSFSMGEAAEKRFYIECRRLFG